MDGLLLVVLLVIGGFALHGYLRGLVRLVFFLASVFLAVALASTAAPYVAGFMRTETPLYSLIEEKCEDALRQKTEEGLQEKTEEGREIFGIELPGELQETVLGGVLGEASDLMEESGIYERLAEQLAEAAVQRIAWAVSFFLVGILLCVLIHVLDVVAKLPVLDRVNRMGGLAVGLLQGLVVVWILFFVIDLLWAGSAGAQIVGSIHENAFLEFLYENNPIERFALGIFGR